MKELKDKIELQLMPEDFEDTHFLDTCNCAISKAFKRQTKLEIDGVSEGVTHIDVFMSSADDERYLHEFYARPQFEQDYGIAASSNFRGKEPIRTIVLNRVK